MANPLTLYTTAIGAALLAGNATEHTHRPALVALMEALAPGAKAINEPQRIACGAPDLVILRDAAAQPGRRDLPAGVSVCGRGRQLTGSPVRGGGMKRFGLLLSLVAPLSIVLPAVRRRHQQ